MTQLTRRQQAIYEFVARQVQLQGIPPTLMEIAAAFGLSSAAGIADHLKAIERKGYIRRRPGASRGIEIARPAAATNRRRRSVRVPVLGTVPGDRLTRRDGEYLYFDGRTLIGEAFAVRAVSDLPDLGILANDLLIMDSGAPVATGDLVLGRQGNHLVLLRAAPDRGRFRSVLGRLRVHGEVELLGRLGAVVRSMPGSAL